jgi:hypothetical protein
MSHSVLRLSCSLAVVCGVSLRHIALLFASLCLLPMSPASIKRWIDALGSQGPPPEEMLRPLLAIAPATECHRDGSYPVGTDHGVMVVQDEHDRLLRTPEAASEHGDEARPCLPHLTARGLKVSAACSADAPSCTEAIKAVLPPARLQADPFHTVKHIGGHLKKSLLSYRRQSQAPGAATHAEPLLACAKQRWQLRGSLRQQPANRSMEAKQAIAELASGEAGLVPSCRRLLRPLVPIVDHAHREAHATLRLHQLCTDIRALGDHRLAKIPPCFEAP